MEQNKIDLITNDLVSFSNGTGTSPRSIGTITGYAAMYYDPLNTGTEYNIFGNVFMRIPSGAFDQHLASNPDVRFHINHDMKSINIGRTSSGTGKIWADAKGIKYSLDLPDTARGHELAVAVERGDIRGSSFTGFVGYSTWSKEGTKQIKTLHRFSKLLEISPVDSPAFVSTNGLVMNSLNAEYKEWQETQMRLELIRQMRNNK